MVNYYELLNVPADASRIIIEQAIKKTRRLWNNRANSPDSSIRAEAEQHVREIAQAEKILLDDSAREEYNRELARSPKEEASSREPKQDTDWEESFFEAYNQNMYDYAAQIARKAIEANEQDGRAWFLYGDSIRRIGNPQQGIDALHRATILMPNDDSVYRQLGFAYLSVDRAIDAYQAFSKAAKIEPDSCEYHHWCAYCLRLSGQIKAALPEAKVAFELDRTNNDARYEYFCALRDDAMNAMSYNRSSGKHLIINLVQLDYVNNAVKTMAMTIPEDENKARCTADLEEIVAIVVDAEGTKGGIFGKKGYKRNYEVSNAETRATGLH